LSARDLAAQEEVSMFADATPSARKIFDCSIAHIGKMTNFVVQIECQTDGDEVHRYEFDAFHLAVLHVVGFSMDLRDQADTNRSLMCA